MAEINLSLGDRVLIDSKDIKLRVSFQVGCECDLPVVSLRDQIEEGKRRCPQEVLKLQNLHLGAPTTCLADQHVVADFAPIEPAPIGVGVAHIGGWVVVIKHHGCLPGYPLLLLGVCAV